MESLNGLYICDVPEELRVREVLWNHFSKFGAMKRLHFTSKLNNCTIQFTTHEAAAKAKKNGTLCSGIPLQIFWSINKSLSKRKSGSKIKQLSQQEADTFEVHASRFSSTVKSDIRIMEAEKPNVASKTKNEVSGKHIAVSELETKASTDRDECTGKRYSLAQSKSHKLSFCKAGPLVSSISSKHSGEHLKLKDSKLAIADIDSIPLNNDSLFYQEDGTYRVNKGERRRRDHVIKMAQKMVRHARHARGKWPSAHLRMSKQTTEQRLCNRVRKRSKSDGKGLTQSEGGMTVDMSQTEKDTKTTTANQENRLWNITPSQVTSGDYKDNYFARNKAHKMQKKAEMLNVMSAGVMDELKSMAGGEEMRVLTRPSTTPSHEALNRGCDFEELPVRGASEYDLHQTSLITSNEQTSVEHSVCAESQQLHFSPLRRPVLTSPFVKSVLSSTLERSSSPLTRGLSMPVASVDKVSSPQQQSPPSLPLPPVDGLHPDSESGLTSWSSYDTETILKLSVNTAEERYRVLEVRDNLLRLRKKNLSDVTKKKNIGTCSDMCPEKERYQREAHHQMDVYEMCFETDKNKYHTYAVKQYSRSSADQQMPLSHDLRPVQVLRMTMKHLIIELMDRADNPSENLRDWYHFLWDRTRAIRKDITQQDICCSDSVTIVEQCSRFHIFCCERLIEEDPSVYDDKINTENLTKCLQTLKYMYGDLRIKGYTCPNEAEFVAYTMLLNLNTGSFMMQIQKMTEDIQHSQPVMFAIDIYLALHENNYVKFFRLIKSTSYLNACLLHRYFIQVRAKALQTMRTAYCSGMRKISYPLTELQKLLVFDSVEETSDVCIKHDLKVKQKSVILQRSNHLHSPKIDKTIKRSFAAVECKRTSSIKEIVSGGVLLHSVASSHKVHNSFDVNGVLKRVSWTAEDQSNIIESPRLVEYLQDSANEMKMEEGPEDEHNNNNVMLADIQEREPIHFSSISDIQEAKPSNVISNDIQLAETNINLTFEDTKKCVSNASMIGIEECFIEGTESLSEIPVSDFSPLHVAPKLHQIIPASINTNEERTKEVPHSLNSIDETKQLHERFPKTQPDIFFFPVELSPVKETYQDSNVTSEGSKSNSPIFSMSDSVYCDTDVKYLFEDFEVNSFIQENKDLEVSVLTERRAKRMQELNLTLIATVYIVRWMRICKQRRHLRKHNQVKLPDCEFPVWPSILSIGQQMAELQSSNGIHIHNLSGHFFTALFFDEAFKTFGVSYWPFTRMLKLENILKTVLPSRLKYIQNYEYEMFYKLLISLPDGTELPQLAQVLHSWTDDTFASGEEIEHDNQWKLLRVVRKKTNSFEFLTSSVMRVSGVPRDNMATALQGTSGILFFATFYRKTIDKTKLRLCELLKRRHSYPMLPVAVIEVMGISNEDSDLLEFIGWLSDLEKNTFILSSKVFLRRNYTYDSNIMMTEAISWLASSIPKSPDFHVMSLQTLWNMYATNDLWGRVRKSLSLYGIHDEDQIPANLIDIHNEAIDLLQKSCRTDCMKMFSPAALEFRRFENISGFKSVLIHNRLFPDNFGSDKLHNKIVEVKNKAKLLIDLNQSQVKRFDFNTFYEASVDQYPVLRNELNHIVRQLSHSGESDKVAWTQVIQAMAEKLMDSVLKPFGNDDLLVVVDKQKLIQFRMKPWYNSKLTFVNVVKPRCVASCEPDECKVPSVDSPCNITSEKTLASIESAVVKNTEKRAIFSTKCLPVLSNEIEGQKEEQDLKSTVEKLENVFLNPDFDYRQTVQIAERLATL